MSYDSGFMMQQAQELAQANAELRRSNQALDDFAYITSDDLRELLRGIHKYAAFLLEGYRDLLDEPGHATLEVLARFSQRMEARRNALLYYTRVGRIDLAFAETDLDKIDDEVLDSLTPAALPAMRCDDARVGEVFRNLITNALKYNVKPQKWIAIGCVGPGRVGRSSRKLRSATAGASGWNPRLAEGPHFIGHWMPTMTSRHQPILLVEDSPEDYEAPARDFRRTGLANPMLHRGDGDSALDLLY